MRWRWPDRQEKMILREGGGSLAAISRGVARLRKKEDDDNDNTSEESDTEAEEEICKDVFKAAPATRSGKERGKKRVSISSLDEEGSVAKSTSTKKTSPMRAPISSLLPWRTSHPRVLCPV